MSLIVWACPLIVGNSKDNPSRPVIYDVSKANGNFPLSWWTTPGNWPQPRAIGVADVDDTQLNAVDTTGGIFWRYYTDLSLTYQELQAAFRNKLNTFCDYVGVARPTDTEVLEDTLNRVIATWDIQTIATAREFMLKNHGV